MTNKSKNQIMYIITLKGNNKDLGKTEFEILYKTFYNKDIILKNFESTFYYFSSEHDFLENKEFLTRLTYTNRISHVIGKYKNFDEYKRDLENKNVNLNYLENKKFLVRTKKLREFKINFTEKQFAKPIWDSLQNPNVSIENFDYEFNFFFFRNSEYFYFTKNIFENEKDYLDRMPKKRPIKMPYTLKSDMARCAINLLNIKSGLIVDPFCGIGGILLEAYDMNFDVLGNDISWNDLNYMKENFDYYFKEQNKKIYRTLADSQNQFLKENTCDGIVTDIPYGRCSRKLGSDLYEKFLQNAKIYLKPNKRLVIIYANFCEFKDLALQYFDEVTEIQEYINASMTRYILVLENKK